MDQDNVNIKLRKLPPGLRQVCRHIQAMSDERRLRTFLALHKSASNEAREMDIVIMTATTQTTYTKHFSNLTLFYRCSSR